MCVCVVCIIIITTIIIVRDIYITYIYYYVYDDVSAERSVFNEHFIPIGFSAEASERSHYNNII